MSTILNEIPIGEYGPYNWMVMYRKYDSSKGFMPTFRVEGEGVNQYLSSENKIIVPYIEYFKNLEGNVVNELTRYKYYEIRNIPRTYYVAGETMSAGKIAIGGEIIPGTAQYYSQGDLVAEGTIAVGGEIIIGTDPIDYYVAGQSMAEGTIAVGGEVVPGTGQTYQEGDVVAEGTIAIGGEIKREQWNAANNWFMLLAKTPTTPEHQAFFLQNFTGIIDAIEYTLAGLPLEIPNGYILQEPMAQ